MNKRAFDGIRVLDFTWLLAGPFATRILADFGAEVIKVQSGKTSVGVETNNTGYFTAWNRNKLSITLNMAHPEGKDLALKLVEKSDIVIENFTPRVMANWGLTCETLRQMKHDIIAVSMSGMGHTGPDKEMAALGPTIQALSGMTYLTSFTEDTPMGIGFAHADIVSGLYAALAITAALEYRAKTGQGTYIDISEFEAMCSLVGPALMDCAINNQEITPHGNRDDTTLSAPHGSYKCREEDSWCVIAIDSDTEWNSLCRIMGSPDWTKRDTFSTREKRRTNAGELDSLLEQWTSQQPSKSLVESLQKAGVPAGSVNSAHDIAQDPQLVGRDFFGSMTHPVLGNVGFDKTPIRLSGTPADRWQPAPQLGEHNHYVFVDLLGLTEQQFNNYVDTGLIG